MTKFNIGKQFSDEPSGRFYSDTGPRSGEAFREDKLLQLLAKLEPGEKINFLLDDNVDGYGSSFLTEGFAGVVNYGYMQKDELKSKLAFSYNNDDFSFYEDKIFQYIDEAIFGSLTYISSKQ